ncbi:MAG TPA: glycerophosphoryl diester phosphodiesterase membrane domain-containing protein [Propionibacteriaceae bacterium]|nr:glycerophosphoryl diester phosphodiesterase membrane domain-containing protein [Propionibacteriaceae bacterium]
MNTPSSGPALRPSPMDVGSVVASTFEVFRRRLGLFVLLTFAPIAFVLALVAALFAIGSALRGSLFNSWDVQTQLIVGLIVGYLVLAVASIMAQLKFAAMTSAAVAEVADGRTPTLTSLWDQTRGVTSRLVVFMLLLVGGAVVVITLIGLFLAAIVAASDEAAALLVLLFLAILPVVILTAGYLGTRLLYVLPVAAIERGSGFSALRRSWALTRRRFWRTFGYNLVAVLIVNSLSTVAAIPSQFAGEQLATVLVSMANSSTPAGALSLLFTLPVSVGAAFLLSMAVQLLTVPFQLIYQTVMYLDQVRRDHLDAQAAAQPFPGPPQAYYPPVAPQQSWTPSQWSGYPPAQPSSPQPPASQPWPGQTPQLPAPQPWPTNPDQPWTDNSRQP